MNRLFVEQLPYYSDSTELFSRLLDLRFPIFIDSARPYSSQGRYDILSAAPIERIEQKSTDVSSNDTNFFERLKQAIDYHFSPVANPTKLPFTGGAIGYFGYDLGREVERFPKSEWKKSLIQDGVVGLYSWAVIVDHFLHETALIAHPIADPELIREVACKIKNNSTFISSGFSLTSDFKSNCSKEEYAHAYNKVKQYIEAGDCYQVNLSQRYSASYEGDPWQAYRKLRGAAAAPYSAYIELEESAILSVSPEHFIGCQPPSVISSPIKGTIKRGANKEEDLRLSAELIASKKNRAENLMIVDLVRNDIGRCCEAGSVKVERLIELESFKTVHHLVSTVSGILRKDVHSLDLLSACFPGGSITGAPKIRAMEIIDELEPHRRSVYCGSIGYIGCDGRMDLNIAIRTLVCSRNQIHCWAGGGIVADSDCESEYQECMVKIEKLILALR